MTTTSSARTTRAPCLVAPRRHRLDGWRAPLLALLLSGCDSGAHHVGGGDIAAQAGGHEAAPAVEIPLRASDPSLAWSLSLTDGGKTLVLDLQVHNQTDAPIWVCDGLLQPQGQGWAVTPRFIAQNGERAGEVKLMRGRTSGTRPAASTPSASFKRLEPGAAHQESVRLPWPEAYNPLGADPLRAPLRAASLSLAWFAGEPTEWSERTGADGAPLKLPEGYTQQWFDGGTQALP